MFCEQDAADVLEAMRTGGAPELHDQVVLFLRALALEAGAAADAGKPLPGDEIEPGRHSIDVPHTPVLIGYSRYPGMREFRVTDLIWLG
jgi:hypothetical protein